MCNVNLLCMIYLIQFKMKYRDNTANCINHLFVMLSYVIKMQLSGLATFLITFQ